jgi:predicted thioredoxin/glutaredoxin
MQKTTIEKKLRIGIFSFTCCEDSTILFTELMNKHYETWRKVLDIRHARVLQSHNVMDEMDVAFVEGAIVPAPLLVCPVHNETNSPRSYAKKSILFSINSTTAKK